MGLRSLTEEEHARARIKGIQVDENTLVDDPSYNPAPAVTSAVKPVDRGGIVGLAGRSVAENAIPAALGGAAAAFIPAFLGGAGVASPTGPGALIVGLGAGGAAAYGAYKLQRKLMEKEAQMPGSVFGEHLANVKQDVEEYPFWSSALALPAAKFAGGSILPNPINLVRNPRNAAKLAAIMGGQDVAMQQIVHPGQFDPTQFAISTIGGPMFAGRGGASSALKEGDVNAKLAELQKQAPEGVPATERPAFDPLKLLSMTPQGLKMIAGKGTGEANLFRVLAKLKEQSVPITEQNIVQLATEGPTRGYENVAREIKLAVVPDVDIAKQKVTANEAAYQERLNAAKIAGEVGQVPEAPARITSITEQGIQQPPSTGEAAASAKVILAAGPKDLNSALTAFRADEKTFAKLATQAEGYQEGTPERLMMTRALAQMRNELDAKQVELFSRFQGAPEKPAGVGLEEVRNPRELGAIDEPTPQELAATQKQTPGLYEELRYPGAAVENRPTAAEQVSRTTIENAPIMRGAQQRPVIRVPGEQLVKVPKVATKSPVMSPETVADLTIEALAKGRSGVTPEQVKPTYTPEQLAEIRATIRRIQSGEPPPKLGEGLESALKAGQIKKEPPVIEQPAGEKPSAAPPVIPKEITPELSAGISSKVLSTANPIQMLRNWIGPTLSRLPTAVGKRFSKAMEDAYVDLDKITGPRFVKIGQALEGLSTESRLKVGQWLRSSISERPKIILTPQEQLAAKALNNLQLEMGIESRDLGPLREAYNEFGQPIQRPTEIKPGYFPAIKSTEFQETLRNPEHPRAEEFQKAFIEYVIKNSNMTPEQALDLYNRQKPVASGKSIPNTEFRGLRYEEGLGLPELLQEPDPFVAMQKYVLRQGLDMSIFKNVESDPVLMRALGKSEYGRGVPLADVIKTKEGFAVKKGELLGNTAVSQAIRDYVGFMDPTAQNFEKIQSIIHVGRLGTYTQARNIVQNVGMLPEILHSSEYKYLADALPRMFDKESTARAIRSGSVRPSRNILPTTALDLGGTVMKLRDLYGKYTGAELLAKANDVLLDGVARSVIGNRVRLGDTEFIEQFGPKDWESKPTQEVIDTIAAKFTKNFAGWYNAVDLPPALLRGSEAQWAPLFKLARWSVGRFNRWYDTVYTPATKGNIKPLIGSALGSFISAGALATLTTYLTGIKPKEPSWSEWFNLGGKDAAYTLFSKLATASFGGILSDLIFGGIQLSKGEMPRSYNNLVFQTVGDLFTRVAQVFNSPNKNLADLGAIGFAALRDQLQVLKLLTPPEDVGKREEKIAQRLGYMPKTGQFKYQLSNPISESGAYKREDVGRLERIIEDDIKEGRRPTPPSTDVRRSRIRTATGYKTYYDFIKEAQGEEAAKAAMERDRASTLKKRKLFQQAYSNVRSKK